MSRSHSGIKSWQNHAESRSLRMENCSYLQPGSLASWFEVSLSVISGTSLINTESFEGIQDPDLALPVDDLGCKTQKAGHRCFRLLLRETKQINAFDAIISESK